MCRELVYDVCPNNHVVFWECWQKGHSCSVCSSLEHIKHEEAKKLMQKVRCCKSMQSL